MYTIHAAHVAISPDAAIFIEDLRHYVNTQFTPNTIPTVNIMLDHWLVKGGPFTEKQMQVLVAVIDKCRIVNFGEDFRVVIQVQWGDNIYLESGYILDGNTKLHPVPFYPKDCPKPNSDFGLFLPVIKVV